MDKRLVILLTESEHVGLIQQARRAGQTTVSNYVRWHLGMDPRQQGVKHEEKRRRTQAKQAAAAKVKAKKKRN